MLKVLINMNDPTSYVVCPICERKMKLLHKHVKCFHELTYEDFLCKYPGSKLVCDQLRSLYSANTTKLNQDPDFCIKRDKAASKSMAKLHEKQWQDPEFRKRHVKRSSNTMIQLNKDPEFRKKLDKESSDRMKQLNKKQWQDPTFIEKQGLAVSKMMVARWQDSDFRSMMKIVQSANMTRHWQNLEFSNKVKEAVSESAVRRLRDPNNEFGYTKAKEAFYNNIRMRSSWEVAFAKSLDHLKINWQYEPKTFLISQNGSSWRYTPDFYLFILNGIYVEIKPSCFVDDHIRHNKNYLLDKYDESLFIMTEQNWDEMLIMFKDIEEKIS